MGLRKSLDVVFNSLGSSIAKIPFSLRPVVGSVYKKRKAEIHEVAKLSDEEKKLWIFTRTKK